METTYPDPVLQAIPATLRKFILALHRLVQFEAAPARVNPATLLADAFELGTATERLNTLLSRLSKPEADTCWFVDVHAYPGTSVYFNVAGGAGDSIPMADFLAFCLWGRPLAHALDRLLEASH